MKRPIVELSECVKCEICVEVSPEVFKLTDSGFVIVLDLPEYPIESVNEAIKNCPSKCIFWEEE